MSGTVFVQLQVLSSLRCWKGIRCLEFKNLECNVYRCFCQFYDSARSIGKIIPPLLFS